MTHVLCWCGECEASNLLALKRDRQARDRYREFALLDGDRFASAIGQLYGPAAGKVMQVAMDKAAGYGGKENPVAHDATYDDYSATMVASAVGAVLGELPAAS